MSIPWLLVVLAPMVVALLLVFPGWARRAALTLAPWAAMPALVLALAPDPAPPASLSWLLLGTTLGLDMVGRVFLFLAGFLWLVAGMYARRYLRDDPHRVRFFVFFLLAMAGNVGLTIATDIASFYLFFALMTFSAYPLIVHAGHPDATKAGRIYLSMAIVGETLVLLAILLVVQTAGTLAISAAGPAIAASPARDVVMILVLAGFGIKVGIVPLHVWLPLAHPVAPTPASAVLSGTMIAAGVLGWLRFLPLGEEGFVVWGSLLTIAGLGSVYLGVAIGVSAHEPKTVLAYSSISHMGMVAVAVGVGLISRAAWPAALVAVLVLTLQHGLAKGSLFLGAGLVARTSRLGPWRPLVWPGLMLPALSLAGAPFTGGATAKLTLKDAATSAPDAWAGWLEFFVPLAAIGSTILMVRFLGNVFALDDEGDQSGREHTSARGLSKGLAFPWALSVSVVALAAFTVPAHLDLSSVSVSLSSSELWPAMWPVIAGLLLSGVAWSMLRRRGLELSSVSPYPSPWGPLMVVWQHTHARISAWTRSVRIALGPARRLVVVTHTTLGARLLAIDVALAKWVIAGAVFAALMLATVIASIWP